MTATSIRKGQRTSLFVDEKHLFVLYKSYSTHELLKFDWSTFGSSMIRDDTIGLLSKIIPAMFALKKKAVVDWLTEIFVCIHALCLLNRAGN